MSKTILVLLMFIGACAGSTGGGIKVSRFTILFKSIRKELHHFCLLYTSFRAQQTDRLLKSIIFIRCVSAGQDLFLRQ